MLYLLKALNCSSEKNFGVVNSNTVENYCTVKCIKFLCKSYGYGDFETRVLGYKIKLIRILVRPPVNGLQCTGCVQQYSASC